MDLSAILSKRNEIYGICAIWIVLFHVYRRISMPYIPVLANIVSIGNAAVDIFMFLSGLSLFLSAEGNNCIITGWRSFYKRRFKRLAIPYFLAAVPYFLWNVLAENKADSFLNGSIRLFGNLSSATFWFRGTQTYWYVYAIAIFYLAFPIIYRIIKKNGNKPLKMIIMFIILYAIALTSYYVPVFNNSTIAWVRLPVFSAGVLAGELSEKSRFFDNKRNKEFAFFSVAISFLLFILLSVNEISASINIPKIYSWILYGPFTLSLLSWTSFFLNNKERKQNIILNGIGKVSLEIYLIHITLLHPIKYYGLINVLGYWLYLILPVAAILLSFFIKIMEEQVIRLFKKGMMT